MKNSHLGRDGGTVTGRLFHEKSHVEETDRMESAKEFNRRHHVEQKFYRHRKRGGLYEFVGRAKMGIGATTVVPPIAEELEKMSFVVYRSVADDSLFVRPEKEFFDGRFEEVWR